MYKPVIANINCFDEFYERVLGWYIDDAKAMGQKTLPIVISSYGGEVYSLMAMIDMLDSSGLDYFTVVLGKAMSCGAFLLSKGSKRFAAPNATIMIHEASRMVYGKNADIQSAAKEIERLNKKAFSWLDRASGKPEGFFQNLVKENGNGDLFLTPEQCLEYGLITDIGLPSLSSVFPEIKLNPMYNEETDSKILMSFSTELNPQAKNIYNFFNKNPNKEGENEMKLTKAQYEGISSTYASKGLSLVDFDTYNSLGEQFQATYMETMKANFSNTVKPVEQPKAESRVLPNIEVPKIEAEAPKAIIPTLPAKLEPSSDDVIAKLASQLQAQKEQIEALKRSEVEAKRLVEKKEDEQFVDNLIRSNKLNPSAKNEVLISLSAASREPLVDKVIEGKTIKVSQKDQLKSMLQLMDVGEGSRVDYEMAESDGELVAVDEDVKSLMRSEGVTAQEAIQIQTNQKRIEAYAREKNIDISTDAAYKKVRDVVLGGR